MMAKKMKKLLSLVLAFSMVMSLACVMASAEGENTTRQIVNEGGKIYYLANPEEGEIASAENYDVWTSKTIEETGTENEFEVTLQVGTTKKAETKDEDVAVILVMDASSSMLKDKNGLQTINKTNGTTKWTSYMPVEGPLMIDYAREAAQKLVADLVDNAGNSSVKLSVVEFGNNAKTVLDWTEANNNGSVNNAVVSGIDSVDVGFTIGKSEEHDKACFWVRRGASFWSQLSNTCVYEGCEDTDPAHLHEVEGCTYNFDNQVCKDTTPFHYHEFFLSDTENLNDSFGRNPNGSMFLNHYLLTDKDGVEHFCIDREPFRQNACGTNMEGGLLLANNLLDAGLAEGGAIDGYENVYVVLLSDGEPTWHVATNADVTSQNFVAGTRGGGKFSKWDDLKNIVSDGTEGDLAYAKDIKAKAALYTVMYGYSGDNEFTLSEIPSGTTVKDWLVNNGNNMVGVDDLYMAADIESGLLTAFGNIGERIEILSKAWTVTDALSDEVIFDSFIVNGEFIVNCEYADYDKEDHAITWNVGDMEPEKADAAGTVDDPYTYTLKYKVKLNPEAEGVYEASADGSGVNTNEAATLYYLVTDGEEDLKRLTYEELAARAKIAPFAHPAVKAFYADYAFTKMDGITNKALPRVGFTIYKNNFAWSNEVFSDENGQVSFEKIPAGIYELKETTAPKGVQAISYSFKVSYGELTDLSGNALPATIYNWIENHPDGGEGSGEIDKSKTASELDKNGVSNVKLSVGGTQDRMGSDIVFVVDKSESDTFSKGEATEMLKALVEAQKNSGATIKVGFVIFNYTSKVALPLTELTEENVDTMLASLDTASGGTNIDAGLIAAKEMLDADDSVDASRKHMILVSDGLAWAFNAKDKDGNNVPSTIVWKMNNGGLMGNTTAWASTRGVDSTYPIPYSWTWDQYWGQVKAWVEADGDTYVQAIGDYKNQKYSADKALTTADAQNHAMCMDRALYDAWESYTALQNAGYRCYAVNTSTDPNSIGDNLMKMLNGGASLSFDEMKDHVISVIGKGSKVVDYIGYYDDPAKTETVDESYNFDFVDKAENITLTVGNIAYTTAKIDNVSESATSTYSFTAPGATEATFTVEYYKDNGTTGEHFVWIFGEDVTNFAPATLSYKVQLVGKSAIPGDHEADTNQFAILYPKDSEGNDGDPEYFEKPTVDYEVPETPVNPPYNPPAPPVVNPPEDPSEPPVEEEIPDEEVPTTDAPVEEEEIPEEDPPLADVPATGDMTALWMAASAVSAAGVLFLGKKNKDEE